MLKTELEASVQGCCGPTTCGRRDSAGDRVCVSSACMAWRWAERMIDGPDSYVSEPAPKGYCGLAGLPLELQ